jgi:hypothetical protein
VQAGSAVSTGQASIVEGAEYEPIGAAIRAKYGVMFTILTAVGRLTSKLRRRAEVTVGIAIELDPVAG